MPTTVRQQRFIIAILTPLVSSVIALRPSLSLASAWISGAKHALEHILHPPPTHQLTLEDLTNTRIPGSGGDILAYTARPLSQASNGKVPVLLLIHEFFGVSPSIVEKAKALADKLQCTVVAPDAFRGQITNFIPKAIWLALSTPQELVNQDLNAVCDYLGKDDSLDLNHLAVMGFCYGGGKAIRYTVAERPQAATVIFYGMPETNANQLARLQAPVCGIYGRNDVQFSMQLLDEFQEALQKSEAESTVRIYDGVGHAFWKDMAQIQDGKQPQCQAYQQAVDFLRNHFRAAL